MATIQDLHQWIERDLSPKTSDCIEIVENSGHVNDPVVEDQQKYRFRIYTHTS